MNLAIVPIHKFAVEPDFVSCNSHLDTPHELLNDSPTESKPSHARNIFFTSFQFLKESPVLY